MTTTILQPGQQGTTSGFPATVVRQYDGNMYEVRLASGLVCISASDFIPAGTITALKGHTSADTAYVVADYPYGFRLRTQIRYWLETNKNGTRFVSQTLNPKTGDWNKPKASTYCSLGVMVRDESNGHIGWAGWTPYAGQDGLRAFEQEYAGALTDFDKAHIAGLFVIYGKMAARKAAA